MSRVTVVAAVVLLSASLATVGCNDRTKQELAALQQQYNDLQLKNQDLRQTLAESQAKNADLLAQLDTANSELASAKGEIARLQTKLKDSSATVTGRSAAKFILASDIVFAAGRATLSKKGVSRIRQIAATIKSTYPNAIVRVYGYTDKDPIARSAKFWKDNLDLSANRAMAVTRQLRKLGVPAEKVETVAMGATHFVAPNSTKAGKARNRRVEIVVIKG